jgi:hypothetical protein
MSKAKRTKPFNVGSAVQWNWMGMQIKGTVSKIYFKPVKKALRGAIVKRNGSEEKPAYLVKSSAGNDVLKLHTELSAAKR